MIEATGAGLFPAIRFGAIGARAVLMAFALVALWLLLDLAHACDGLYRRLRREAGGRAGVAGAFALVLFASFAAPFAWAMRWLLRMLAPLLSTLRLERVLPREPGATASLGAQGFAVLAALGFAVLLWHFARMTWHGHVRVVRARGPAYLAKGYALMALMRLRQNRHDFFKQVPVVSNVRELVLAVVVHEWARGTLAAGVLPGIIVAFSIVRSATDLCPPLWILGRSRFETYHLFTTLRFEWGVPGINLLDRSSDDWRRYYQHWRSSWIRAGLPLASSLLNRPGIQRTWSLRPRGELWMPSAWNLMGFLPVVVIDARVASRYIDDEILWAIELGCLDKVWLVGADDGSAPAVQSAFEWARADQVVLPPGSREAVRARVVRIERLAQGTWSGGRLVVAPATAVEDAGTPPAAARAAGG